MLIPRACLMGHPVAHSRSPMIHGYWLKQLEMQGGYDLKDILPEDFDQFIKNLDAHGYVGGNITVPHKEAAFAAMDWRDPACEAIGALNVVWLEKGRLHGLNSDVPGFVANLDAGAPGWDANGCTAVVMGAGGGARSAIYALKQRGARVHIVNRGLTRAQALVERFGPNIEAHDFAALPDLLPHADVLVNCTSCGMVGKPPLEVEITTLKRSAVVYDIVYVPLDTPLLAAARARGHRTVDGLGMLLQQAGVGFEKWFGRRPSLTPELRTMIEADIRAKT